MLRWAEHIAAKRETRNAYRILTGEFLDKFPLGKQKRGWENDIKMGLREIYFEDRRWIELAQDCIQ
jgi:hypothetical protein